MVSSPRLHSRSSIHTLQHQEGKHTLKVPVACCDKDWASDYVVEVLLFFHVCKLSISTRSRGLR